MDGVDGGLHRFCTTREPYGGTKQTQWLVWANERATREHVGVLADVRYRRGHRGNLQNWAALKGLLAGEKLVKVSKRKVNIGGPRHVLPTTQPAKPLWVLGLCI